MPRTIVTSSPISEGISRRFFEALNALEALGLINSQEAFCNSNKLSPPRYRAMRLQYGLTPKPGYVSAYRNIEVEALYALVFGFPVSADWLLTGRGEMLTKKIRKAAK